MTPVDKPARVGTNIDTLRRIAADAAYEDFDFDSPVAAANGWEYDSAGLGGSDVWRRTVFLEMEGRDSRAVTFTVKFPAGASDVIGLSIEDGPLSDWCPRAPSRRLRP